VEPAARIEPVVRIRCASPEDEARCRRILGAAGLAPEASLTWLVVRDADPDRVNHVLAAGGALGRTAVREAMGKLIGWLIDRQGALDGRARNVKALVERVLADGALAARYQPRPDDELVAEAARLYREIVAGGAPFLPWAAFVERFCHLRTIAP
jgi:hypothetical protein